MKFPVMTAILLIAPTFALASPGAEATAPSAGLDKRGVISSAEIAFEKKQLRLHVIERSAPSGLRSVFTAHREGCDGPTKILRHGCVKGQGVSSARGVTSAEVPPSPHDHPNRRQTHNSRQTSLEGEASGMIGAAPVAGPKPGKPGVKPAPAPGSKPYPLKPGIKPFIKPGPSR